MLRASAAVKRPGIGIVILLGIAAAAAAGAGEAGATATLAGVGAAAAGAAGAGCWSQYPCVAVETGGCWYGCGSTSGVSEQAGSTEALLASSTPGGCVDLWRFFLAVGASPVDTVCGAEALLSSG